MDGKIRDYVRAHLAFRYVEVSDYATAIHLENAVKGGALGAAPHLIRRRRSRCQRCRGSDGLSCGTDPAREVPVA
jgi:hypothetical protein